MSCEVDCGACPSPTCSSGLFFSEYLEGTSQNKAIELYNDTDAAISLSGYRIDVGSNGGAVAYGTATELSGSIPAGGTHVICHGSASAAIKPHCDKLIAGGIMGFNGDDAIVLYKGQDLVDTIGNVGDTPNGGFTIGTTTKATLDHTLRRKPSIEEPVSDWSTAADGWEVFDKDLTDGLGNHVVDAPCLVDQ